MKIQEYKINNKKVIQIYLNKNEREDVNIQRKIDKIKTENNSVVLFVSGDNDPEIALKEIVKIMQNVLV